jgi:hypothetical protein
MKKFTLLLAATLITFGAIAQVSFDDEELVDLSVNNTLDIYEMKTYLQNNATDPNDTLLEWHVIGSNATSEWELSICNTKECIADPVGVFNFNLGVGKKEEFKLAYGFFAKPGNGEAKLVVRSAAKPTLSDTLYFKLKTWGASMVDANKTSFNMYPNPATNAVRIDFKNAASQEVKVYDILGNLQITKTINSGELLDITSLTKGVYVVRTTGDIAYSKILHKQ